MKTILIKGKQGSGKTTLGMSLVGVKDSGITSQDGFRVEMLLNFKNIIIDECNNSDILKEQMKCVSRVRKGKLVCITQNEDFNEEGFDLVFRLK